MKNLLLLLISLSLAFYGVSFASKKAPSKIIVYFQEEQPQEEQEKPKEEKEEQKEEEEEDKWGDDEKEEEQVDWDSEVDESMKYFKEKYEITFDEPFEIVFRAVKKSIQDLDCMIAQETSKPNVNGLYKGLVKSDYCLFTEGTDTTFKVLKKYSYKYELPFIRGGIWETGRMKYRFLIQELNNNQVYLLLQGELSGMEKIVTGQVHFWQSNGILETRMLERVTKNIQEVKY